jgi:thiol-disulfide isomerase/thioredoxin
MRRMKMSGRKRWSAGMFGLALVGSIFLAACGAAVQPGESENHTDSTSAGAGEEALDFEISLYSGQDVVGGQGIGYSDLLARGNPVVLNVWAGACPPCRLEMPDFQEVSDEFGSEVLIIGLDVGPFTNLGTNEQGRALIDELGITYPTGTTSDPRIVREISVIGMPTTLFVTPDGEITKKWTGLLTKDQLTELIQELIEASDS